MSDTPHVEGSAAAPSGVTIGYDVCGDNDPAIVFVHGWSCDRSYWDRQVEHFSQTNRVVTIDLAGHGRSGRQRDDWSVAAFGADVATVLDALDLHDTVLVGHSMGAAVIAEAAQQSPLGYNFRPRKTIWHGRLFVHSFLPAASPTALKTIGSTIRQWRLHHWTQMSLDDLAARYNAYINGWINYFGHFYGSRLSRTLLRIDAFLTLWARRKYRRLSRRPRSARAWLSRVRSATPDLFAHWRFVNIDGRTSGAV